MRTRLFGAVLVPIAVMCSGAVQLVSERSADAQRAEGVVDLLTRLSSMTELRSSLFSERLAAEILVPAREPDADLLARTQFGGVLIRDPGSLTKRTDRALAALAPSDRPFSQSDLDLARSDRQLWAGTIAGIGERLGPLYDMTTRRMLAVAVAVRTSTITIADDRLVADGTTFERSIALPGAAAEVLRALTDLYLAAPGSRTSLQSDIAAALAVFDGASTRFSSSLTDPTAEVARWLSEPQPPADLRTASTRARNGLLTEVPGTPAGQSTIEPVLLAGVDWLVGVDQIPSAAITKACITARQVAAAESDSRRNWLLLTVLVLAVSILVVLALARSIVAPVRRLTDQAQRVGAGDLEVKPLPERGPPDVAVACAAMNDVVASLVLIRQKALALADGRLADPALQQVLPGLLGAEIEHSSNQLTRTLIERQALQAQLLHDATHDSLTGLANRAALVSALEKPHDFPVQLPTAVVFIDLNDFKKVNDRHGHATGDQLLRVVSCRLLESAPTDALVCRWGGDEFVVTFHADGADAMAAAAEMIASVSKPETLNGSSVSITACAGVAICGENTLAGLPWSEDLLRQADLAVYHAKTVGSGSIARFDAALAQQIQDRTAVEAALSVALAPGAGQLHLVYQPILQAGSLQIRGMEALLRWRHPDRGHITPDQFIPVAEQSQLIVELDQWVLRTALRQLSAWNLLSDFPPVPLSVNLSVRSLVDLGLVERVSAALSEFAVPAARLILEVTETAMITDPEHAWDQLRQLRAIGVQIALDDFGTGFTSVSQLRDMPVDELKIDKSFIQALHTGDNLVLVTMINDLAHHLNLPTVAEGVETQEQREVLEKLGCDALQGFLFARPQGPEDFLLLALSGQVCLPDGAGLIN